MSTQSRVTTISDVTRKPTAKGELFIIATSDGPEYSTFQGALANQAYSMKGQQVQVHFTEKVVTRDGRSFTNRYFEGVGPAQSAQATIPSSFGTAPAAAPAIPSAAPTDGGRELKIMRQTATKVGAHLLAYLPLEERTPSGLLLIADYLVEYYEHGRNATPASLSNDPGPIAAPTHTDDDIPFMPTIDGLGN